ncbi:MAG: hypothetical protein V4689_07900 [Verrucomicrobiota bacterium]
MIIKTSKVFQDFLKTLTTFPKKNSIPPKRLTINKSPEFTMDSLTPAAFQLALPLALQGIVSPFRLTLNPLGEKISNTKIPTQ